MKPLKTVFISTLLLWLTACASTTTSVPVAARAGKAGLPAHPDELRYPENRIVIPRAAEFRYPLVDGNVAYIVPDPSLPLVSVTVNSRAGEYLLGDKNAGLADLTASMLRDGGTRELTPEELDERLEFLATSIRVRIAATQSSASMDSLSVNLDESLELLFDILAEPRFDGQRTGIKKNQFIEGMKRRNDDTRNIESRVFNRLRFGEDSYRNNLPTAADIDSITAAQMKDFAERVFSSPNLVIAVSGDVDPQAMVASLNRQLQRLKKVVELPPVPTRARPAAPGLYGVNKDDVTQTRVRMFHPGPRRGDPQEFDIRVMNDILGGGGFTSRITKRIRSDEGLAYSAGSLYRLGIHYPGMYMVYFQSKNPSVPEATRIALEEIRRMRQEPVSEEELETAKQAVTAILNERYSNARRRAAAFAADALIHTPDDYWHQYERRVAAVSVDSVLQAAREHLHPDELRILLTGKLEEAIPGDGEHGSIEDVTGLKLRQIPLRDPLTLEPLPLD